MSQTGKIRVAVLTRGDSLESWEVNALNAIKALPFAEIVMEIRDGSFDSDRNQKRGLFSRIVNYKWKRLFWNRWFKRNGKIDATQPIETAGVFHTVPLHTMVAELKGKHSQYFSEKDIAIIRLHEPDVILRFGFNILRGDILTVAKHGVWSYHHADHETIRGGPAGFWEYMLGHNITGAILQRLTDKLDDGIVLRKGYWSLVKHSFRENLDQLLNNSSGWMANALTEIHYHSAVKAQTSENRSTRKVYSYPGNIQMIQFWLTLLSNKIAFHWNNLFRPETWKIGVVEQSYQNVLEQGVTTEPKWITAEYPDQYLADPFATTKNGAPIVLAERYSYSEGKGIIVNALTGDNWFSFSHHISFPFVVCDGENEYNIFETADKGELCLRKIETGRILSETSSAHILMKESAVDAVLFQFEDRWWILCCKLNDQNNSALFAYYADELQGIFTPHALNPVKTDIRNSRSGGTPAVINGKLYRPAQDSSNGYGSRIVVNEIVALTPTRFEERATKYIVPDRNWDFNKGLHTVSPYGADRTLIDAKSFRFNFANFRAQLKRKTGRIAGK